MKSRLGFVFLLFPILTFSVQNSAILREGVMINHFHSLTFAPLEYSMSSQVKQGIYPHLVQRLTEHGSVIEKKLMQGQEIDFYGMDSQGKIAIDLKELLVGKTPLIQGKLSICTKIKVMDTAEEALAPVWSVENVEQGSLETATPDQIWLLIDPLLREFLRHYRVSAKHVAPTFYLYFL